VTSVEMDETDVDFDCLRDLKPFDRVRIFLRTDTRRGVEGLIDMRRKGWIGFSKPNYSWLNNLVAHPDLLPQRRSITISFGRGFSLSYFTLWMEGQIESLQILPAATSHKGRAVDANAVKRALVRSEVKRGLSARC
jgi:hypothetical protein